ncbi:MAG: RNA 2',3'-cyclic phosphodiesterase [Gallionella sp.]|nr:RNA 2',3'-cyclic phosphodiesterase [Gallionella sp.]
MSDTEKNDAKLRLFFALWPDEAERAALAAWQEPLRERCGGRVMRPDTLHTTLLFLGDVAAGRLEALQLAAREVTAPPFELEFELARYWGHNHIVFAAPRNVPPQLVQLVRDLERNVARHRFLFDRRPYKPHATLLRHAQWSDAPLPAFPVARWRLREFVLLCSRREEQVARYEVLHRFPLG